MTDMREEIPGPVQPHDRKGMEEFEAGDSIRGIASVMVVICHAVIISIIFTVNFPEADAVPRFKDVLGPVAGPVVRYFELAVIVFFVLSGYLIGRPFVRAFVEGRKMPNPRTYARRRFFRIVPMFYFAAILTLVIEGANGSSFLDVLSVFAGLQTVHPTEFSSTIDQAWTIDAEAFFYILMPVGFAALYLLGRGRGTERSRLLAFLALMPVLAAAGIWLKSGSQFELDNLKENIQSPWGSLYAFVPGLTLAALEIPALPWFREADRTQLARVLAWLCWLAAIGCFVAYALIDVYSLGQRAVFAALGSAFVMLGPLIRQWAGLPAWRWLVTRPAAYIGQRSLSIYLLHVVLHLNMVQWFSDDVDRPGDLTLVVLASTPVLLIAAELTYRFIELPANRYGHRRRS